MKKIFSAAICVLFISQIGLSKPKDKQENQETLEYVKQIHDVGLDYETTKIYLSQIHKNEDD